MNSFKINLLQVIVPLRSNLCSFLSKLSHIKGKSTQGIKEFLMWTGLLIGFLKVTTVH